MGDTIARDFVYTRVHGRGDACACVHACLPTKIGLRSVGYRGLKIGTS